MHLGHELPPHGEVLLEVPHRVQPGRRLEPLVEHRRRGDPVEPVRAAGVEVLPTAQQVPAAVPDHHRPRLDVGLPLPARLGAVAEPQQPALAAGPDQGRGGGGVGPRGAAVGRGCRRTPHRLGLRGDRFGQRPDDLAERAADRVVEVVGVAVRVQRGHHQAERLVGAEHQRRQPQPAADPVAAVGAAHGLDRDVGLAQDRDVAAGRPLGDPEGGAELGGGDAGPGLQHLERAQRPGGGTGVGHAVSVAADPAAFRPDRTRVATGPPSGGLREGARPVTGSSHDLGILLPLPPGVLANG